MVSLDSKYGGLKEFYKLLSDFRYHKPVNNETKIVKNRIMNNVNQLQNKYFGYLQKIMIVRIYTKKIKIFFDPNQFKALCKKKLKLNSTEENTEGEMQKSLWFEINRKEFEESTEDIYNNQDNKDSKIIVNKKIII